MTRSHDYLRELFTRLLAAMQANASDEVQALWDELDHGLLAHLEAEERFVLPVFARVDPDEARALLREHGLIREQLLELGIAVDLHCIRYARSHEFIELLRRHAGREENLLYRWADERLPPSISEAIKARMSPPPPMVEAEPVPAVAPDAAPSASSSDARPCGDQGEVRPGDARGHALASTEQDRA